MNRITNARSKMKLRIKWMMVVSNTTADDNQRLEICKTKKFPAVNYGETKCDILFLCQFLEIIWIRFLTCVLTLYFKWYYGGHELCASFLRQTFQFNRYSQSRLNREKKVIFNVIKVHMNQNLKTVLKIPMKVVWATFLTGIVAMSSSHFWKKL